MSTSTRILIRRRDLAEALDMSERSVARLERAGLPCVELPVPGRHRPLRRYDLEAVRRWLGAHARGDRPTPEPESEAPLRRGRPRKAPA